jgi:uncharacterized FlgJ-related protein
MEKHSIFGLFLIIMLMALMQYNSETVHRSEMEFVRLETRIELDSLKRVIEHQDMQLDSIKRRELNWENIDYWMEEFGVKHKEIVMRQVYLETGNLSSTICRENNNLFGMKLPRVRKTTAIGSRRGHAEYDDFVLSILDYAIWQENMYNDQKDYYAFLRSVGYAECKSYIQKLKYIEKNIALV